jgi:hypothetical protein
MPSLGALLRENLFFIAVILLIVAAFVFLRTEPSAVGSFGELRAMLVGGKPTIIEFYSNT